MVTVTITLRSYSVAALALVASVAGGCAAKPVAPPQSPPVTATALQAAPPPVVDKPDWASRIKAFAFWIGQPKHFVVDMFGPPDSVLDSSTGTEYVYHEPGIAYTPGGSQPVVGAQLDREGRVLGVYRAFSAPGDIRGAGGYCVPAGDAWRWLSAEERPESLMFTVEPCRQRQLDQSDRNWRMACTLVGKTREGNVLLVSASTGVPPAMVHRTFDVATDSYKDAGMVLNTSFQWQDCAVEGVVEYKNWSPGSVRTPSVMVICDDRLDL